MLQVVADSGAYTQACDVWSIGVITYMLLSGTPPFKGDTDTAVLQAVRAVDGVTACWRGASAEDARRRTHTHTHTLTRARISSLVSSSETRGDSAQTLFCVRLRVAVFALLFYFCLSPLPSPVLDPRLSLLAPHLFFFSPPHTLPLSLSFSHSYSHSLSLFSPIVTCATYVLRAPTIQVRVSKYTMEGPRWEHISSLAKDFISKTLVRKPKDRLTADQALHHPWLAASEEAVSAAKLDSSVLASLRRFSSHSTLKVCGRRVLEWRGRRLGLSWFGKHGLCVNVPAGLCSLWCAGIAVVVLL